MPNDGSVTEDALCGLAFRLPAVDMADIDKEFVRELTFECLVKRFLSKGRFAPLFKGDVFESSAFKTYLGIFQELSFLYLFLLNSCKLNGSKIGSPDSIHE